MSDPLADLTAQGVSIWLDDISRERLVTGNLQSLIDDKHIVGVPSNPTIFQKALEKGHVYDDQIRDLAVRGVSLEEAVRLLTSYDIRSAATSCDPSTTGPVAGTGASRSRSIRASRTRPSAPWPRRRALWWLVDRPNLFIKIPATQEGVPAITAALAEGISIDVTLIFSLERYAAVWTPS